MSGEPCGEGAKEEEKDERADLTLDSEVSTNVLAESVAFGLVEDSPELECEKHYKRGSITNGEDDDRPLKRQNRTGRVFSAKVSN